MVFLPRDAMHNAVRADVPMSVRHIRVLYCRETAKDTLLSSLLFHPLNNLRISSFEAERRYKLRTP